MIHDSELLTSMARKLQELEQQLKARNEEMLSKEQKILALEDLVQTLQQHQSSTTREEELETQCIQLQRQVGEMEVRAQGWRNSRPGSSPESLERPGSICRSAPLVFSKPLCFPALG
ncbi:UBX domain containing 5, isoform CRA_b [Rattus norvegicus]|uniref:UBX domain containing 5, isoform CRA_b n=1 Tax=Rattus norvegicus TaxID=10116 RepID=A6IT03_RAT|nr:UBX domain containing 5, isoform CRA_b [Rattus norvegicus]